MASRERNKNVYLLLALVGLIAGAIMSAVKMHRFEWGNHDFVKWGVTVNFNDVWYYNCQNAANFGLACAVAAMAIFGSELSKTNVITFVVKYVSVFIMLVAASRFCFGLLFYNEVTIFEELFFVLLLIHCTFKAKTFYLQNIKVHGKHVTSP